MEKLSMCRICLVENVHMYVVVNRSLHELYEKLTDIPFVTEDRRPMLACFFCCAKLKQCYRLLRKCLKAEELLAQMINGDNECNPLISKAHLEFSSGFIKSPTETISIVDVLQTESMAIKEELPIVFVGLDDIIEPKEEHQSDGIKSENFDNSCLDVADIPPQPCRSDLEDDVSLMEFKTEFEEQALSKNKQRSWETRIAVAKIPKLEDATTAEQMKKDKSDSKVIWTTQKCTSNPGTYFKGPYKCDQPSFNRVTKIIQHTRTQIGENPYKCNVCQRSFSKQVLIKRNCVLSGENPLKCNICERSFNKKAHLSHHIRIHSGEKPYKCDLCPRSFSAKSNLSQHIRLHTGEKPFKCDVCERSFSKKGNLLEHTRIHSGEKPFKCVVCQRSFSKKAHLSHHIRIHTGEKPYKCDVCQRGFSEKGNLTNHIRIHTGEKPFMCDVCQRSFREKGHLKKHILIHSRE